MTSPIDSIQKQFQKYKLLAEHAMDQVQEKDLFQQPADGNSIAILVKHLHGNMLSRWTNFLEEDGEKPWRRREEEFHNDLKNREDIRQKWEAGWRCLFDALAALESSDLVRTIYIREQPLTVMDAILRQFSHYIYHIGQIVLLSRLFCKEEWKPLEW